VSWTCFSVACTRAVNGHCKSANSTIVTNASLLPQVGSSIVTGIGLKGAPLSTIGVSAAVGRVGFDVSSDGREGSSDGRGVWVGGVELGTDEEELACAETRGSLTGVAGAQPTPNSVNTAPAQPCPCRLNVARTPPCSLRMGGRYTKAGRNLPSAPQSATLHCRQV
jgi:hypothetical protein